MKLKIGDVFIALLIIFSATFLSVSFYIRQHNASNAQIFIDGKEVTSFKLNPDEDVIKTIDYNDIHFNVKNKIKETLKTGSIHLPHDTHNPQLFFYDYIHNNKLPSNALYHHNHNTSHTPADPQL